ncbi:DUF6630 family protein [Occultella gossypii]|uniref:DUF1911 domain-containing protein n=1 Tax=Occultella gossypii TaxID=2800820 RepID=A0ABS7SAL2_9MICO|nr:PoNe immunity protein domain-containing protein [Occultella gossypii]MBZ2196719.1 DUF1911 domain-containing protein [Occultella gossypii]
MADIDTLAAVALNEQGRRVLAEASAYLAQVGPEQFGESYPDLADDFSDEAPAPITLLLGVGQAPYPVTIGWCDWSGEDDPGQVRRFVDTACGNLGLTPPAWDSGTEDRVITELGAGVKAGQYVPALLVDVDIQLRAAGLRLLLIDTDSDTYQFVPVTTEAFRALEGAQGAGFTLTGVGSLTAPASTQPPHPPQESAPGNPDLYARDARGPVCAVAVELDGKVMGYLFHGLDGEENKGGLLWSATDRAHHANRNLGPWTGRIKELRAAGIAPAQGVASLLGVEDPAGAGRVGAQLQRYESTTVLDRFLNPGTYQRLENERRAAEQRARDLSGYGPLARPVIDATLRGEIRITEAWAAQIHELDTELRQHPAAQTLDAVAVTSTAAIDRNARIGSRVREPSYLRTYRRTPDLDLTGAEVVVELTIPAGTAALTVAAGPFDPAEVLLLDRGTIWEVESVSSGPEPLRVRAHLAGREPDQLLVGRFLGAQRVLRDPRADEAYFDDLVVHQAVACQSDDRRLRRPDDEWRDVKHLGVAAGDAMKHRWARFSALYSQGASPAVLREEFDAILRAAERADRLARQTLPPETLKARYQVGRNKDFYRQWLWLVTLGLTFDVDDHTFDRVVAAVELGWGDRLLDRLIATRRPQHPIGAELAFPRIVGPLDQAIATRDLAKARKQVAGYLSKWYPAWKGTWGWGGHDLIPKRHYWGYWAFEVPGLVAALGLDEATLRDDEYYPGALLAAGEPEPVTRSDPTPSAGPSRASVTAAPVSADLGDVWAAPASRPPGLYAHYLGAEYQFTPAAHGRGTLRTAGPPPGPGWRPDGWTWVLEVDIHEVELFMVQ